MAIVTDCGCITAVVTGQLRALVSVSLTSDREIRNKHCFTEIFLAVSESRDWLILSGQYASVDGIVSLSPHDGLSIRTLMHVWVKKAWKESKNAFVFGLSGLLP